MKLSAESKTVNEILSRNIFYEIPRNQRKYVWSNQQLEELFEDVFYGETDENHFMGCIVLELSDKNIESKYNIIDGQQRLTTYNIILLVISKILFELNDSKKALSNKKFIVGDVDGEEINKILVEESYLNDLIECVFQNYDINAIEEKLKCSGIKQDKYNSNIINCFMYYYKKMNSIISELKSEDRIKMITELKNKLLGVNIIEIVVPYDNNAVFGYKVFEVLNARGIPLEQHELIKNYIFSHIKIKKHSKNDKAKKQWNSITELLVSNKSDNMNNFFSHYTTHKYGTKASHKSEFETIKANCDKSKVGELLNDLVLKSQFYSYICFPESIIKEETYNNKIYKSLEYFKNMNIRQIRPLLMSLFSCAAKEKFTLEELTKIMLYLENFYFQYVTVCNNKTNMLESLIFTYAEKFENNFSKELIGELKKDLNKYAVKESEFIEKFKSIGYSNKNKKYKNSSNKKTVYYILEKIDSSYDEDDEYEINKFTIEHIMCDSETNDVTSLLGNLLPLSGRKNNRLSDAPFVEKVKVYKKSNLLSVKKFVEYCEKEEEWNSKNIEIRNEHLAKYAIDKIWKLN